MNAETYRTERTTAGEKTDTQAKTHDAQPVTAAHRIVVLDALRGFALMGIALANFPEFSLWTFLAEAEQASMPTAGADRIVRFLQYLLVDGKFYTIFSVLFGIGFSIIISHAAQRGAAGFRIFYRRMAILLLIGVIHMMFIWSGDILALYALMGMALPLFRNVVPKRLLRWAAFFLLLPIAIVGFRIVTASNPAEWFYAQWWTVAGQQGIHEDNFATWLRDAESYREVFSFLFQGAVERMWEFVAGQRYFKVLGLFIIGYYIGRQQIFQQLETHRRLLVCVLRVGMFLGLPMSVAYAYESVSGHPWGSIAHEVLYALSVYPLGLAYMAGLCLLYLRRKAWRGWQVLAYPGRMALTCYIGQSLLGILLFYGIGFGWGAGMGLCPTELISLAVFAFEILLCALWLRHFHFGPLEWLWRMLTYGRWFKLVK